MQDRIFKTTQTINQSRKLLGTYVDGTLQDHPLDLSTQCARVPVLHGHIAQLHIRFRHPITTDDCKDAWSHFQGLELPSSPPKPVLYLEDSYRPQPALDRDLGSGMVVSVGRLSQVDSHTIKMTTLSHNIIRGAAGGGVLIGELLVKKGTVKHATESQHLQTQ